MIALVPFVLLLWLAVAVEHNTRHRNAGAEARYEAQMAAWGRV